MKNDYEIRGNVTAIFIKRRDGSLFETIISTSDLDKIKEFNISWCVHWKESANSFYVVGNLPKNDGKTVTIYLHRCVLNDPKGLIVDHINHDTLINTRWNLRAITHAENIQNRRGANRNNSTGIRGVSWNKHRNKWLARLMVNGKHICLGYFENINEAERVVIEARKKYMIRSEWRNFSSAVF
ncbi:hypothetical protein FOA22_22390 [Heyndrickxia oleronia]|uniref:AP2 domain-containing protein n=1 Tax=Heyndrickxia oleronia TaxID=38875 RepID=UPI003334B7C5